MSSTIGNRVRLSIFGESHGEAIGCVLDGLPAGEALDMEEIRVQMARRAPGPGQNRHHSPGERYPRHLVRHPERPHHRRPLAMVIRNENQRSGDYQNLEILPRPGHADFTGHVRYNGYNDVRGGGLSVADSPPPWCSPGPSPPNSAPAGGKRRRPYSAHRRRPPTRPSIP